jgi:2-polyprenyl-6-methoxyphenol hydroxylase-like FAD-dependent oxidoreductase
MNPSERSDVLVIGAGPVGLTLACELKRHGVSVRLVEKREKPLEHPNAAIVHVRTLEILSAMGAVRGFLEEGYPFPGIHVRVMGKRVGFVDAGGVDSPYPMPRTLGQHITERLLNQHFERLGGRVERSIEAVGLEQDAGEVRVRLRHLGKDAREETATASWVVGCEGSSSMTREALGISFSGERYTGKEFLQVDAEIRWSHPHGFGYQFLTAEHVLMCFAYNDRGFYRIICARNDANPENNEPPTLEEMQALVQKIADPCAELTGPTWFNRFRTGYRLADKFRKDRVFLAGDAGHVHIPIGGQGMNYGMHDAFNLGWKLAEVIKGEAKPALLDTYEAERRPVDEALIRVTDRGFHLLVQPHRAARMAMRVAGPVLLNTPFVLHRIRDTLAEMKVAYPTGVLSEDHGGSSGPVAGDRAPDALVVRLPERQTVHLFDVLHGTRWTLLLFAGLEPTAGDIEKLERFSALLAGKYGTRVAIQMILCGDPPVPVHENWAEHLLMDREQEMHGKYGVTCACLYLIRPDWYVAFRGGPEHQLQLVRYLERVFTGASG